MASFSVKKVRNCSKDVMSYEYRTGYKNHELTDFFASFGKPVVNEDSRSGYFSVNVPSKMRILGLLSSETFRVSYYSGATESTKAAFEARLKDFGV